MKTQTHERNSTHWGVAHLKQLRVGETLTRQDIIAITSVVTLIEQLKPLLRSITKLQDDIIERYFD